MSQQRRIVRLSARSLTGVVAASIGLLGIPSIAALPRVSADPNSDYPPEPSKVVAYLWNVTVRSGYDFANRDEALDYGYGICRKVSEGHSYAKMIEDVKTDFDNSDEYQAEYLITQAVNELCPAQIWQLRKSASHYGPADRG